MTVVAIGGVSLLAVAGATSASPRPVFKEGGTLTVGIANDPDALDPTLSHTSDAANIYIDMCEKLYDINAQLQIVPQLAAALPVFSENKKTVTIELRKGIRFNDGTPFDAAAVKQSLERDKTLPGSARASDLAPVASIGTRGNDTVILHLSSRDAPLTSQLATVTGIVMSPKALNELGNKFATDPVCVGPFTFKERVTGDHITLVRSPYYYAKSKVHLDSIVFKVIVDPTARTENLRAHSIDVEDRIQSTDLPAVKADPSLWMIKSTSLGYQGLTINIGNKNGVGKPYENIGTPFARSAELRQAFELAIDRNLFNRVVFGGTQRPSCSPFPDQSPYVTATKGIPCHLTADVAAAKAAFKRSGASAPVDVHLLLPTGAAAARFGVLLQDLERPIGFNVIPEPIEFVGALARLAAGTFDATAIGRSGSVDPDGNLYPIVNSKGSSNYGGYSNAIVDRATNQARSILDPKRRIEQYHIALAQIAKDLPVIYLYNPINRFGVSKKVGGVQVYGDGAIRVAFAGFRQ